MQSEESLGEQIRHLRVVANDHQVLMSMISVVERLYEHTVDLQAQLDDLKKRYDYQLAQLQRSVDKLKGVHGA